jgi:putative membrane protein
MPELGIVVGLVAAGGAYGLGVRQQWASRATTGLAAALAYYGGIAVLAIALLSPLDGAAHRALWMHMVQHVLLISVAAPLLAAGRPVAVARAVSPWWPPAWRVDRWATVVVAAGVEVATLLVWHIPWLYDAALAHDAVHGAEHVTLLVTAVALWIALVGLSGEQGGLAVVVLFVVSFPPLLLGAAMTFATTAWYPAYATPDHQAVTDQQLAGVVMWAYGGLAAVAGGVYLFVSWLRRLEALSPGRSATAPIGGPPSC